MNLSQPKLITERLELCLLGDEHAASVHGYFSRNADFRAPCRSLHRPIFSEEHQRQRLVGDAVWQLRGKDSVFGCFPSMAQTE